MRNSSSSGVVIGALLAGAAIGGILGILFAPDKGSKTRKKIVGETNDLTDTIKEKFDDFLEEIKEEVEAVKEKAEVFMGDGSAKGHKLK